MKTYTFWSWVVENGTKVHKEFVVQADSWSQARTKMSEAIKAYQ